VAPEQVQPWSDRGYEVGTRQCGKRPMARGEMQCDAARDGERFGREQRQPRSHRRDVPRNNRVGFDRRAEGMDAEERHAAVKRLHHDEGNPDPLGGAFAYRLQQSTGRMCGRLPDDRQEWAAADEFHDSESQQGYRHAKTAIIDGAAPLKSPGRMTIVPAGRDRTIGCAATAHAPLPCMRRPSG
jgi:hypothetical protein